MNPNPCLRVDWQHERIRRHENLGSLAGHRGWPLVVFAARVLAGTILRFDLAQVRRARARTRRGVDAQAAPSYQPHWYDPRDCHGKSLRNRRRDSRRSKHSVEDALDSEGYDDSIPRQGERPHPRNRKHASSSVRRGARCCRGRRRPRSGPRPGRACRHYNVSIAAAGH